MQLRSRVFIVTGASSGLGAAVTRMLAGEGAIVLALDVKPQAGEKLAAELGATVHFRNVDVTNEADATEALAFGRREFGRLDGLVNCAGTAPGEKILGRNGPHGLDSFARAVTVNLVGTFNMMRLAAEVMSQGEPDAEGERGVIINTADHGRFRNGHAAAARTRAGLPAQDCGRVDVRRREGVTPTAAARNSMCQNWHHLFS